MIVWGDLFRWSKAADVPAWLKALPAPAMFPSYLTFVCLLPAALLTNTLAAARRAVAKAVLLSSLAAIIAYALDPAHQNRFLVANALFHYIWIILFFCTLPALLVLLIRSALERPCKADHG